MRELPVKAGTIIEFMGESITWEVLKSGEKWYAWASHTGDEEHSFKFNSSDKKLDRAVLKVARDVWRHGPEWVRTWDTRGRKRKSKKRV
jgi:hypothetical protein